MIDMCYFSQWATRDMTGISLGMYSCAFFVVIFAVSQGMISTPEPLYGVISAFAWGFPLPDDLWRHLSDVVGLSVRPLLCVCLLKVNNFTKVCEGPNLVIIGHTMAISTAEGALLSLACSGSITEMYCLWDEFVTCSIFVCCKNIIDRLFLIGEGDVAFKPLHLLSSHLPGVATFRMLLFPAGKVLGINEVCCHCKMARCEK